MKLDTNITNFDTLNLKVDQSYKTEKNTEKTKVMKDNSIINSDVQNNDVNTSEHDVIQAIEKANKHIKVYDRRLEFSIHEPTKQIMVKVINTEDDSVIREIPSEKILDMVAHLWELAGILVDEKR